MRSTETMIVAAGLEEARLRAAGGATFARVDMVRHCEDLARRFGGDDWPATCVLVARVRATQARMLAELEYHDEALKKYAALHEDLQAATEPALKARAADAQHAHARLLETLGRDEEARALLRTLIDRDAQPFAQAVVAQQRDLDARGQQARMHRGAVAHLHRQEVARRGQVREAELVEARGELRAPGGVEFVAAREEVRVAQRGRGRGQRRRGDVEARALRVHARGQRGLRHAVADAQAREAEGLGEGARHDRSARGCRRT